MAPVMVVAVLTFIMKWLWYILGGAVVLSLLMVSYTSILKTFLPSWESFSPTPYWDYKQWSWGYGTRVPGSVDNEDINPGGTIDRATAMSQMLSHIQGDYSYLKRLISRDLTASQWAALLSFSYNEGVGNADNLTTNINSGNDSALELQWKKYIYAGGVVSSTLVERRNAEWQLWTS